MKITNLTQLHEYLSAAVALAAEYLGLADKAPKVEVLASFDLSRPVYKTMKDSDGNITPAESTEPKPTGYRIPVNLTGDKLSKGAYASVNGSRLITVNPIALGNSAARIIATLAHALLRYQTNNDRKALAEASESAALQKVDGASNIFEPNVKLALAARLNKLAEELGNIEGFDAVSFRVSQAGNGNQRVKVGCALLASDTTKKDAKGHDVYLVTQAMAFTLLATEGQGVTVQTAITNAAGHIIRGRAICSRCAVMRVATPLVLLADKKRTKKDASTSDEAKAPTTDSESTDTEAVA